MEFRLIHKGEEAADYLAETISARLAGGGKVLWLIAGGSAMGIAIHTADRLKDNEGLSNLAVSLTDERYGPVGHADSNWKQLQDKGFSLPGAKLLPVLIDKSLEETANHYKELLDSELLLADYSVALAGMGADGHIFGIKPGSPSVDAEEEIIGYRWDDYIRLTPTFKLLERLDEVVLYTLGTEKHAQIDKLGIAVSAEEQPAQLLKKLKKVVFFNDYKGELV